MGIRIGINYGPVVAVRNEVHGRHDYFGSTVNVASRVEASLEKGGLTGVTQAMLDAVGGADFLTTMGATFRSMGKKTLKGQGDVDVFALFANQLKERWEHTQDPEVAALEVVSAQAPLDADASPEQRFLRLPLDADASPRHRFLRQTAAPGDQPMPTAEAPRIAPTFFLDGESHTGGPGPSRGSLGSLDSSVSSVSRGSSASGYAGRLQTPMPRALQLGVVSRRGTTATVRVALSALQEASVFADVSAHIMTISLEARRMRGVLVTVLSSASIVVWNTSVPCPDHMSTGAHFLRRIPEIDDVRTHAGASSGPLLFGNLPGVRGQNFSAVIGECVDASLRLAEEAQLTGVWGLASGEVGAFCATERLTVGQQMWECGEGRDTVIVYVLKQPGVSTTEDRRVSLPALELCDAPLAEPSAEVSRKLLTGGFRVPPAHVDSQLQPRGFDAALADFIEKPRIGRRRSMTM